MSIHHHSLDGGRHAVAACSIAAALLLCLPANGWAQGQGFTSPLIIPAAAFEESGVRSYGTHDRFSDSSGIITSVSDEVTCVMAPVYLPNSVKITRFEAAVADLITANPSSSYYCPRWDPDVRVELVSNHMDDNLGPQDSLMVTHASVTSTLDTGQMHIVADSTISTPIVNNLQQIFWVRAYVCGQFQLLQGVRIFYEE